MNQKVILISIILIILISTGGYFLFQTLNELKTEEKTSPQPYPTSPPTPTSSPQGPTGTIPLEVKCSSTLPSSYDICFQNEGDNINILKCVDGNFVSSQAQNINEVNDFSQRYFQKTFTQLCSKNTNCKGITSLIQGDKTVKYTCRCEDRPPTDVVCDVCSGNTWVCNKGEYICDKPTSCGDLKIPDNKTFTQFCSNKGNCQGTSTCTQEGNKISIKCKKECPKDTELIKALCQDCKEENTLCVCDQSTLDENGNYTYKCIEQRPLSEGCPPKPENVFCKDELKCISCAIGQDNGYIWYCPGNEVPKNCLVNAFGLTSNIIDGSSKNIYIASRDNNQPPVFPTIDNDSCLQTAFSDSNCGNPKPFTSLLSTPFSSVVDQWRLLDNPAGYLYKGSSNKERGNYSPYAGQYLVNNHCFLQAKSNFNEKKDMTNACIWTKDNQFNPRPDCNSVNGGVFFQDCIDRNGNKVKCPSPSSDEYNNFIKLGTGTCDCSNALVQGELGKKYTGDRCQYSDKFTCNNNGIAQFNGTCLCNTGFAGDKCQYDREKHCNNLGNPLDNGDCKCDTDKFGNYEALKYVLKENELCKIDNSKYGHINLKIPNKGGLNRYGDKFIKISDFYDFLKNHQEYKFVNFTSN